MADKIYLSGTFAYREDTLENWQNANPVLEKGEPAIVRDGADGEWLKIGDGVTSWNDLPWKQGPRGEMGPVGPIGPQGIQGPKGEKGDGAEIEIDQTYSPESENAQSGIAVAEALLGVSGGLKDFELLCDTTITEDVAEVKWTNADSGEPISNYKDLFIYFYGKFTAEETKALFCNSNNGGQYYMWNPFNKKTSFRALWISIETVCGTDKIDAYPNESSYNGMVFRITKYPKSLLGNVSEANLSIQGLSDANADLRCDTTILNIERVPFTNIAIGNGSTPTAIFAAGSRFLLLGRKA